MVLGLGARERKSELLSDGTGVDIVICWWSQVDGTAGVGCSCCVGWKGGCVVMSAREVK